MDKGTKRAYLYMSLLCSVITIMVILMPTNTTAKIVIISIPWAFGIGMIYSIDISFPNEQQNLREVKE